MPTNPRPGYPRLSPYLNDEDTGTMMNWLARAFSLVERHSQRRSDGQVMHAEMAFEDGVARCARAPDMRTDAEGRAFLEIDRWAV